MRVNLFLKKVLKKFLQVEKGSPEIRERNWRPLSYNTQLDASSKAILFALSSAYSGLKLNFHLVYFYPTVLPKWKVLPCKIPSDA